MKKSLFSEKLNERKAELAPKDGKDGYTPIKGVDYFDGKDGYTPIKGIDYVDGKDGVDGYTPVKNVDYFDGEKGEKGDKGDSASIDEDKLLKKLLKKLPENKASLKVIRETIETDPMSVIDKVMELAPDRLKLKTTNIEGLEQTIRAFHSQLGRGYLHGGGISNITGLVTQGTNITITGSGTATDPYIINSTGGASFASLTGSPYDNANLTTALNAKADKTFAIAMAVALG